MGVTTYQGKNYKLYLGDVLDALKKLPSESVDMVFTSPPYNLGLQSRKDTNIAHYENWDDDLEYKNYVKWQLDILSELYRILKEGGQLFYNHKDKFRNEEYKTPLEFLLKSEFKIKQNIIWNRGTSLLFNTGLFNDVYENVYWMFKGKSAKPKTHHEVLGTIWTINKESQSDHPAPFPLELPLRAIYSIFDDEQDKVVLDPFSGSGTTGVAALLLNHKYIGIDNSETYLLKSVGRLENYMDESSKGQREIDRHMVKNKYKRPLKNIDGQGTIFDNLD